MSGTRLDIALEQLQPELSRASVQKLIKMKKVSVNGAVIEKPSYKISESDEIDFSLPEDEILEIELPIIYEDDDCVVIEKPVGLLTHSKGTFNPEATVETWLRPRTKGFDDSDRSGIVHRLDRATSGVMICAKNPEALSWLQKQFSTRKVKKTYLAVIEGSLKTPEALIDMPIERNPKQPQRFRVGHNGKPAQTYYKVIKEFESKDDLYSLVELKPTTGRTHQLRVHLNYLKKPILGDEFYDGKKANRLYLHAHELEITMPSKERKVFSSKMPKDFLSPGLDK
ncbi:RluA family pseudouridine synthase [Candidatus Saccharibacteria bacterium]|nr:RluA family pseudouridine synthase [Candidatus Saccharibacteria bacterium]